MRPNRRSLAAVPFLCPLLVLSFMSLAGPRAGELTVGVGQVKIDVPAGVEIEDSHETVVDAATGNPRVGLNRPTTIIVRDVLYLGYDTPTGPDVLRLPLLR